VVFTTLTRRGMPLIRYRTGDLACIIPQPCPCGSALRRMGRVKGRRGGSVRLGSDCTLTLPDLDEALFQLPGLLDYRAIVSGGAGEKFRLQIGVHRVEGGRPTDGEVHQMLNEVEAIRKCIDSGNLEVSTARFSADGRWNTTGVSKRKIVTLADTIA